MPKKLQKLEPKHMIAVRMKVQGKTNAQIAEEVGAKVSTVKTWFTDPMMHEEVAKTQKQIGDIFAEKMANHGLQALDLMRSMMDMPISAGADPDTGEPREVEYLSFNQRLELIDRFLNLNPHTNPPQVVEGGPAGELPAGGLPPGIMAQLNIFNDMTPTQLMKALDGILKGGGLPAELVGPAQEIESKPVGKK